MVEKSDIGPSTPDWANQFYGPFRRLGERVAEFFSPTSDAASTDDFYEVNIELPGVSDTDIEVKVQDERLVVSGEKRSSHEEKGKDYFFSERSYGHFQRAFRLPANCDENKVSATHKDGVLSIKIAKASPQLSETKSIPINKG